MNVARTASGTMPPSVSTADLIQQIVGVPAQSSTISAAAVLQLADGLRQQLIAAADEASVVSVTDLLLQSALSLPFVGIVRNSTLTSEQNQQLQDAGVADPPQLICGSAESDGLHTVQLQCGTTHWQIVAVDVQPIDDNIHRLLSLAAGQISEKVVLLRQQQLESHTADLAGALDLVSRCGAQTDEAAAARMLVNSLKDHLRAAQVFLGRRERGEEVRLLAISDHKAVDARSETVRQMETVLQESLAREEIGVWPAEESDRRHALRCHQQLAADTDHTTIISTPLISGDEWVGSVVVQFAGDPSGSGETQRTLRFLSVAQQPLADTLRAVDRASIPWWRKIATSLRRLKNRTAQLTVLAMAVLTAALLIPVDYQVDCVCELQPSTRRFVATPFDAPLDRCLVQPGDVVEQGQILAQLDGRELRWEQAAVSADLARAAREHDAFLAEQDFGKAAIARHEMERLQNRAALLRDRFDQLQVASPIAGIVVAGDWKDSEGVPLETGDSLFEIAPLDSLLIEISIPEDDVRHVQPGMPLQLQLNSIPGEVVPARLDRIHPRAELKDNENVFIAEARLDHPGLMLKPGMRGEAQISTGQRPLGWNLFHKPWAATRYWLGW